MVLSNAALLHQFRRELEPTLACADETIRLADQLGMVQLRAWASIHRGWALAYGGRAEDGLAEIEAALATWRAIGGLNNRTHFLNLLAEACRLAGKPEAGMVALDEAEDISRRVDLHAHDAETHRRRGELHLALGRAADAKASWLRAIEVAVSQGTKTLELRAATNLARLWRDQDKRAEARDLLAPIYGWFTEGFDTTDLKEAAALLEELR
jgi:adenylate cyclase